MGANDSGPTNTPTTQLQNFEDRISRSLLVALNIFAAPAMDSVTFHVSIGRVKRVRPVLGCVHNTVSEMSHLTFHNYWFRLHSSLRARYFTTIRHHNMHSRVLETLNVGRNKFAAAATAATLLNVLE